MGKLLASYFSFSKKELNGIIVLFAFVSLILLFPFCYSFFDEPEIYDPTKFRQEIAQFKASAVEKNQNYSSLKEKIETKILKPEYFEFDPNTATETQFSKLGLSAKQIRIINNYRTKKGRFYKREDLRKIYSITESQYLGLEPFIEIPESRQKANKDRQLPVVPNVKKVITTPLIIELNTADSTRLDQLRGIGPAFASRIIRYRNRLGGFYAKEQLKEVYGMDSIRYAQLEKQITVDPAFIKRLKINGLIFDDLRNHPYLTYKQINAMIQYRKQHGNYASRDDLKKVLVLNEEIIRKIGPYLAFDQ